jgi:hypothetical protein
LCGIASNVPQEDAGIRKKFPELSVGDQKGTERAQTVERLVAVLFGSVLIDWRTR